MARPKKTDSAARRKARREGLVKTISFEESNGLGTKPHLIECERCHQRHQGGEQSWVKGRPCLCGHEYARYV